MGVKIKVKAKHGWKKIHKAIKLIKQGAENGLDTVVNKTQDRFQENAPVMWGDLISSIRIEDGNLERKVIVDADHAGFVEFGTGKHNTKFGGRSTPWAFTHPEAVNPETNPNGIVWTTGQEAQRPLGRAVESLEGQIEVDVANAMREELQKL